MSRQPSALYSGGRSNNTRDGEDTFWTPIAEYFLLLRRLVKKKKNPTFVLLYTRWCRNNALRVNTRDDNYYYSYDSVRDDIIRYKLWRIPDIPPFSLCIFVVVDGLWRNVVKRSGLVQNRIFTQYSRREIRRKPEKGKRDSVHLTWIPVVH